VPSYLNRKLEKLKMFLRRRFASTNADGTTAR